MIVMFSKLSTELLCIILAQLDSLQDLYSAVCASTSTYKAFQGARHATLSSVIRNIIWPNVIPDALFALRACAPDPQATEVLPMSLVEAEQLCHLWHSHEYFVKRLVAYFMTNLNAQLKAEQPSGANVTKLYFPQDPLAPREVARVRRALLRYSAFQSIISNPLFEDREEAASRQVASLFAIYAPWEIEEVACVYQYISNRLEDVIQNVEDHFVSRVQLTEQKSSSTYLPCGPKGSLGLQSMQAEAPFFEHDNWIFTKDEKRYQRQILTHLGSLGLPFLRSLFEAGPDSQKDIITENHDYLIWDLGAALAQRPHQTGIFKTEDDDWLSGKVLGFEGDRLEKRNLAWLWAHQNRPEASFFWRCNTDLREWGYIFWDSDRLQRCGILNEARPSFDKHELPPRYNERESIFDRPSAQERLRELGLA
jgi:hypothetical protein